MPSISKLYGVPLLEIASSNKEIADVNLIFEGQQLKIPSAAAAQLVSSFITTVVYFLRVFLSFPYCTLDSLFFSIF